MPDKSSNSLLNYRVIGVLALLLFTIRVGFGSIFTSASDITPDNVARAINSERTQRDIPSLNYNSKLAAAAQFKADDMITRKYFAHQDPDGHYIWDKIVALGYAPYSVLGENLAVDFSDTAGLVAAWMDSPMHRENILRADFVDQGMGVSFGNTANGEFDVAIANTFGALQQPTPPAPKPAPAPAAAPTPTPAPKPQPAQIPKPIQLTSPKIIITNTAATVYSNSVQITGQTLPNLPVQILDLSNPQFQPIELSSDVQGLFAYTFNSLANGSHSFKAQTIYKNEILNSNVYKIAVAYNPPIIKTGDVAVSARLANGQLILHIVAPIQGEVTAATATVASQIATMQKGSDGNYSADLAFEQYFNYQSGLLEITAENSHQNKDVLTLPLKNVSLAENPKILVPTKSTQPDLYNAFKYVVIVFGGLFILFLGIDLFKHHKNKTGAFSAGNNSLIVLLLIGTALLVSWWH